MSDRPNSLQVSAGLSELHHVWVEAIAGADPDERKRVADIVRDADLETVRGCNKFCQSLMVEIIGGNLSPAVAIAMRSWFDIVLVNIDREHAAAGSKGALGDQMAFIADLRQHLKPVRATYAIVDKSNVVDAVVLEPEKVKVAR